MVRLPHYVDVMYTHCGEAAMLCRHDVTHCGEAATLRECDGMNILTVVRRFLNGFYMDTAFLERTAVNYVR